MSRALRLEQTRRQSAAALDLIYFNHNKFILFYFRVRVGLDNF